MEMRRNERGFSPLLGLFFALFIGFFAMADAARGEEAPVTAGDPPEPIFHLKSDVISISEAAFLVFEEFEYYPFFLAPHDPVESSFSFSCTSLAEAIGVLEKQGKIKIGSMFDDTIFLGAPLREFEVIKTLAEENYQFVQKAAPLSVVEGQLDIPNTRSLPGLALINCITKYRRRPFTMDQVPAGELGFSGKHLSYETGFSLAAAVIGCHMYLDREALVVCPVNPSREPQMMPIVPPRETTEPFRVIATVGWGGGTHVVIQHAGEMVKLKEKQRLGDHWRVLKIRMGEVDLIDEQTNRKETLCVP